MAALRLTMLLLVLAAGAAEGKAPHIVFMLVDDLGYNAPGYRNADLKTPTLDALAANGTKLEEYYVFKYCAPTRGSFLTGRFPFHLSAVEYNLIPWSRPIGTNLSYTMLPEKLKEADYKTHHIGKWHQGFFTEEYIPIRRGFDTMFGFLVGGEDHYTQSASWSVPCKTPSFDLFDNDRPAFGQNGTKGDDTHYNGYTFTKHAVDLIEQHPADSPMFMYFALHNTHGPIEAPDKFVSMYNFKEELRNVFDGMVSVVDEQVKNVTEALKRQGMWEDTVFVWSTDNGSPVHVAGSNFPLRGGKGSNWEGGTRVPAFYHIGTNVSPDAAKLRGQTLQGVAHVCDWYTTFSKLAGLDPSGSPSAPTPVNGLDLLPWLTGAAPVSPRNEIVYDHRILPNSTVGALRVGNYKIHVGAASQASWYGQFTPNATFKPAMTKITACRDRPCVFDVHNDPQERIDLGGNATIVAPLLERWNALSREYHPPANPSTNDAKYCAFIEGNRDFVAPWM